MRVAIVGAGIAGLAASIYLSRAGFNVTLFERAWAIEAVGSGILLQPSGLAVLNDLGILEECLAEGAPIQGVVGTSPLGRRLILNTRYDDWKQGAHGLGIHRSTLHNALYHKMKSAGVDLVLNSDVYNYINKDDKVDVFVAGISEPLTFDALILANGRNSTLQFKMPVIHKKTPYKWGALWATSYCPDNYDIPYLRQWYAGSSNMFGILPIGPLKPGRKNLCSLFLSMRESEYLNTSPGQLLTTFSDNARMLAGEVVEPFLEPIRSDEQISFASYTDIQMSAWNHGRILAIGDCAHSMSPQLGQGANMALVDARALLNVIVDVDDLERAFELYSKQRKDHLRFYQSASRALTPLFQSSSAFAGVLRDLVMVTAQHVDFAKRHAATTLVGGRSGWIAGAESVDLHYWDGSF